MPVLTAIDVIGIQSYIFASNRLRDVIGASYLVESATKDAGKGLDAEYPPEPDVVLAAGGNAILSFETLDDAKSFVLGYTRRLLDQAPGLEVAIAHCMFGKGELARGLLALQIKLAKAKLARRPHVPQLGLGVTQPCAVTGLPATFKEPDGTRGQSLSRRIEKIRDAIPAAKSHWQEFARDELSARPRCHGRGFRFPDELDRMGRTHDDTSQIGVVHVDGNAIGKRIQKWLLARQQSPDQQVLDEIGKWSTALDDVARGVFCAVMKRLTDRIEPTEGGCGIYQVRGQPSPPRQLDFELATEDGAILLPLRPILLGGDDLTFVCDGRLAMDLATTALRAFGDASQRLDNLRILGEEPITACAGVALVRPHAPFSRSYELCERLCANAKQAKRAAEANGDGKDTGSWLDWHLGAVRPDESPDEIRRRQYEGERLTCRPYPLDGDPARRLTWVWLDTRLLGEPAAGGENTHSLRDPSSWGERRNKVKALRKLLREGGDAIKSQIEAWKTIEGTIGLPAPLDANGFKGTGTPLLDAVELLDIHMRLEPPTSVSRNGSNSSNGERPEARQ